MTNQSTGVIARKQGADVELTTILVPDPGKGEVLVRVKACGVCHTDLHYRAGSINNEFPFLLGHEASGIIESVGEDVTNQPRHEHFIGLMEKYGETIALTA